MNVRNIRILALLLAVIFLGAQFHYCSDLNAGPANPHICPICSAVGAVLVSPAPGIALAASVDRFEFVAVTTPFSVEPPHATSPRAPPLQ